MASSLQSLSTIDAARLRAILDTAVDGILTIGADGIVQSANQAVTAIFGFTADELIGHNVSILMPSPQRDQHDGYLSHYLETGDAKIIGRGREVVGRHKSGRTFPIYLAVSHAEVDGEHLFTGIVRDITAVKELEDGLRAANAAKSEFLSSMSHELRTPLNAILGFGQLIIDDNDPIGEKHRAYLDNMLDAGQHLLSLINSVLDLSQIETGNIQVRSDAIDLTMVIDECANLISPIAKTRGISVSRSFPDGPPPGVVGDFLRVKQVLLNLMSNAVKYNSEANGSLSIDVTEQDDGMIRIAITNTGPGIAPERRGEVFERFNRLDQNNSSVGGTGIGLAISRNLVELMGGAIGFQSVPEEITTFWVDFPATALPTTAAAPADDRSARFKILYVEDALSNLTLMESLVEGVGDFSMIAAHDSAWAADIIELWHPDVIVVEIGAGHSHDLCDLKASKGIPMIAIAGTEPAPGRDKCDFYRVLRQPISQAEFRETLRAAVSDGSA